MLGLLSRRTCSSQNRSRGAALVDTAVTLPIVFLIVTSVIDLYRLGEAYLAAVSMADTAVTTLSLAAPTAPVPGAVTALVQRRPDEASAVTNRRANAWGVLLSEQGLSTFSQLELQSLNAAYGQLVAFVGSRDRVAFPIPTSYQASDLGMVPNVTLRIQPNGGTVTSTAPAGTYRPRVVAVDVALNTTAGRLANYALPPFTFRVTRYVPKPVRIGQSAVSGSGTAVLPNPAGLKGSGTMYMEHASYGG